MLENATLLRVDPPAPAPAGAVRASRSTLCPPTAAELRWLAQANLFASATLYLPLPPSGQEIAIGADDLLQIRSDGQSSSDWIAVNVSEQIGGVIRYVRVFLTTAT